MAAATVFATLDMLGTFAFGLSGAMVAIRRDLDLLGILVLSAATGVAGGILRDLFLGDVPPGAIRNMTPLAITSLAAITAFLLGPLIERVNRPVMVLDAAGLGVFAVAGCHKALLFGLHAPGAILLGVMTAVGGGIVRDIMAAELPRVLREEVYALAAFAGAGTYAAGLSFGIAPVWAASVAVVLAFVFRLVSVRMGWRLPRARKP